MYRQFVTHTDLVIVRVMSGGDLEGTAAEFALHVLIGNDRNGAPQYGYGHLASDESLVAFIIRVDSHSRVAKDGLRTRGGHRDELPAIRISQHVFEVE